MAKYYILNKGNQEGPYDVDSVLENIKNGSTKITDSCWCKGMEHWEPIEKAFPKFVLDQLKESQDSFHEEKRSCETSTPSEWTLEYFTSFLVRLIIWTAVAVLVSVLASFIFG